MKIPTLLQTRARHGFTLIEILTTVVIIMILAGLTVAMMHWAGARKAEELAKSQLGQIRLGLDNYYNDTNSYPDGDGGPKSSNEVYKCLFGDENNDGETDLLDPESEHRRPVYARGFDPKGNAGTSAEKFVAREGGLYVLKDPWGGDWRYRKGRDQGGSGQNPDYDVWSLGKDGKDGAQEQGKQTDDVRNW